VSDEGQGQGPPAGSDPYIGRRLADRYDVLFKLGSGGQAAVYAARHVHLGRKVAIKLLLGRKAESLSSAELILREARVMGGLGHPHVCEARDAGVAPDGTPFLVLELLSGRPLAREIERAGRLSHRRALDIATQVGSALAAAHDIGIVHRDLKPDNVWLLGSTVSDQVKVLDFGIAHEMRDRDPARGNGRVAGTPGYMAPEALTDPDRADHRADVYSLGVLLYEMLGGARPYASYAMPELLEAVVQSDPDPLDRLRPDVMPALAAIVAKAMARDPGKRYATMAEMLEALENLRPALRDTVEFAVAAGATTPAAGSRAATDATPASPAKRPAVRRAMLAAALAGLAGLGAAAYRLASRPITIELRSATPGAVATLRGASHSLPYRGPAARHDRPEMLEVSAAGFQERRLWLTLDRDQSLVIDLEARPSDAAKPAQAGTRPAEVAPPVEPAAPPATDPPARDGGPEPARARSAPARSSKADDRRPAPRTAFAKPVEPRAPAPPPAVPAPAPVAAPAPSPEPAPTSAPEPVQVARSSPPAAAPAPPGPVPIAAGVLQRLASERRSAIEGCIAEDPAVGGRLVLEVAARPDGTVRDVIARSGGSGVVRRCIAKQVRSWRLPAAGRDSVGAVTIDLE